MTDRYSSIGFDGVNFLLEANQADGTVVTTRLPMTPTVNEANRDALNTKAVAALAANATFLAIASPTAQVATQAKALTRQMDALIRLVGGQLDSTDGT